MKGYKGFCEVVKSTGSSEPSVSKYFFVKCVDNLFIFILLLVIIGFFVISLVLDQASHGDQARFALWLSSTGFGVFLGMYIGRKIE